MKTLLLSLLLGIAAVAVPAANPVVKSFGTDYPCRKTAEPLKLDGDFSAWIKAGALPLPLVNPENVSIPDWNGPEDIQVICYMLWDDNYLYFAAVVDDTTPVVADNGSLLYIGDGLQLAFDPANDTLLPGYDSNDIELGLGSTAKGVIAHCWIGGQALKGGTTVSSIKTAVHEFGKGRKLYEAAIPWKDIAPFEPGNGKKFGFDVIYNDANKDGRRGWVMWTPGVAESKLAFLFRKVKLVNPGEGSFDPICANNRKYYQSGDDAQVYCYLFNDGDKTKPGSVDFVIRKGDKIVHEEQQKVKLIPGLNVFRFDYSLGRLKNIPLECSASFKIAGDTQRLKSTILCLSAAILKERWDKIAAANLELRKEIKAAEERKIAMDYPKVTAAVADITLKYRKIDLENSKLLNEIRPLPAFSRQLDYLDKTIADARQEVKQLTSNPQTVKTVPHPKMTGVGFKDGMFVKDGQPLMLIGPLGWFEMFSDLDLIAEAGFNIISDTLIVDDVAPAPGKTRNDYIQAVLRGMDAAEKANLAVDFLPSPHPIPEAWKKAYPELTKYPSHDWIGCSFYVPALRKMVEEYYAHVFAGLKDHPSMVSWDLINEWSFSDGEKFVHPTMKTRFLDKMKKQYGTIAALNKRWKTAYADFAAIDPMALMKQTVGGYYDWQVFCNEEGAGIVDYLMQLLRKQDPNRPCHIKTIAVMDFDAATYGPLGLERETVNTDISGCDCGNSIHFDFYKSMHPDRPSSDSEVHVSVTTTPEEMITDNWSSFLHGQSQRLLFAWLDSYSAEMMAAGALLHVPWTLEAAGRSALDIRRLTPEIIKFQNAIPLAQVAILFSQAALQLDHDYPAALQQAYLQASQLDTQIRFVSERQIKAGALKGIKLLIIPAMRYVLPETRESIAAYLSGGGRVFSAPEAMKNDPYDNPLPPLPRSAGLITGQIKIERLETQISASGTLRPLRLHAPDGRVIVAKVELRTVAEGPGKLLAYIINYGPEITVKPVVPGKKIAGVDELISGGALSGDIKIETRKPLMLRISYK